MAIPLEKLDSCRWLIPKKGSMRVPGLLFSTERLLQDIRNDQSLVQVCNVAAMPGIVGYSLAMPDIHWGYGFPIGGVAAFDAEEGVISPGGVGYDINCGCRLMTTSLRASDLSGLMQTLVTELFKNIPTGIGSTGSVRLSRKDQDKVAVEGAAWAVKNGYGEPGDLNHTEDRGTMDGADPSVVSERARKRGIDQLGTLGSGNHFLEIQVVDTLYDAQKARAFGLFEGQVTVFIHSGSRGYGHQVCDDFLKEMGNMFPIDTFQLPDRQLVCAPLSSDLGRRYLSGMACAANYAWANRQILMHWTREVFQRTLQVTPRDLGMHLLYDVCHNIAKREQHILEGTAMTLCVHRKGATRALPPKHPQLPDTYRTTGQPVLIPGDMGTYSFVLAGAAAAMQHSFGSSCHGAGRVLSRSKAIKLSKGRSIHRELEDKGILVQSRGKTTLKEEMPDAYKDVSQVVGAVHDAGLATKVARLRPLGVIKG